MNDFENRYEILSANFDQCRELAGASSDETLYNAIERLIERAESAERLVRAESLLLKACRDMLTEIRAYQGEMEFEKGSIVKGWCDMLKLAIATATGDPADFAQLPGDISLLPEEEAALQKFTNRR